ncbi:hypothetical protein PENTCL1PPCAC_7822, partial [Pristionchus entomophagus]
TDVQSMSITVQDHLKHESNRCLLIVLSQSELTHSQLDEENCCETLLKYGSIKKIQLTSDCRAAFVDFSCEHAPLLVARCFELHQTNPDVPMPRGATALLPGCSINNFLYLHHVPRHISNLALHKKFTEWNKGRGVTVVRPVHDGLLSSRVVIVLSKEATTSLYTQNRMRLDFIDLGDKSYQFYAIPQLQQLTNYINVCYNSGCQECNVDLMREKVKFEEENQKREAVERENVQKKAPPKKDNDDYSTPRAPPSKFPDITEESELRRWGMIDQKPVSPPPLPPPEKPRRKVEKLDWKNFGKPKEIPEKKEPARSSLPIPVTIEPSFNSFNTGKPDVLKPLADIPLKKEEEEEMGYTNQVPLASLPSAPEASETASVAREPPLLKGILKKRREISIWTTPEPTIVKSVRFDACAGFDWRRVALNDPVFKPREDKNEDENEENREIEKNEETGE